MPLRIVLAKQILERKILLNLMIQKYKKYDVWLSRFYNLASGSTALIATLGKLVDGFSSASTLLIASSIISLTITKIRDIFKFNTLVNRCKEQLVKYDTLYQKILTITTDPQVQSIKESLSSLKDFDVEIDHEVLIDFQNECKKYGIKSASDDVEKLKTLDVVEAELYSYSSTQRQRSTSDNTIDEIINGVTKKIDNKEEIKTEKETKIQILEETILSPRTKKKEMTNKVENLNLAKDLKESLQRFSDISSLSLERLEKVNKK